MGINSFWCHSFYAVIVNMYLKDLKPCTKDFYFT
jgi:hypothetical protein